MASKGEPRTSNGPRRARLRGRAAAFWVAMGTMVTAAHAQGVSSRPDNAVRAPAGAVLHYEESRATNILYLEQKGGMASAVSIPAPRNEPAAKAAAAEPVAVEPTPAKARRKTRRTASSEGGP